MILSNKSQDLTTNIELHEGGQKMRPYLLTVIVSLHRDEFYMEGET